MLSKFSSSNSDLKMYVKIYLDIYLWSYSKPSQTRQIQSLQSATIEKIGGKS